MNHDRSRSKAMYDKALTLIPGGVNSPVRACKQVSGTPVYFQRALGSHFWDLDGNLYTDFCQSWGPLILGHAQPEVVDAVRKAAGNGLSYGACHEKEIQLAELVLGAFPEFQRIRFVNSGTEAVMTALRVARGGTNRDLVVKFEGGYHGHFDGMLVKAGSGLATTGIASSRGVPQTIAQSTLVAPLDDEQAVEHLFATYGPQIAAIIIEPLPANNGLLIQRKEFLNLLREITLKNGSLLIFDEVISGFRLHFGGYGQLLGITPDLVTLGKIIGGGMPVGAVMGRAELMDNLSPLGAVYQAGTLSGNPVSLAAGIATLQILQRDNPYPRLEKMAQLLIEALSQQGIPFARALNVGSIVWLYFDEAEFPRRADTISIAAMKRFTEIYWELIEQGYYLPPSSYEVLFLSTAHREEEISGLAGAVGKALISHMQS